MKVVMISNYLNHHQLPFCQAMYEKEGVQFNFVATIPTPKWRMKFGYSDMNNEYEFVIRTYENAQQQAAAMVLCESADVVITGGAPRSYIEKRLAEKKLTFCYSERIYKEKCPWYEILPRAIKYYFQYGRYKNLHLLCASAYTAGDYAKTGTFLNKAYKWGYFPEVKRYDDVSDLIKNKKKNSILWVARLLPLKHPEAAIAVAERLRADGYDFQLNIMGSGALENSLQESVDKKGLSDYVNLLGNMPHGEVRKYMEESQIFLFTSDRNEGWGAVLNESMNSACAVVASHEIGAAPFLINDSENGYIYQSGNTEDLYNRVKTLIDDNENRKKIQLNAYKTIIEEWNGQNAADKFVSLTEKILAGDSSGFISGVCSKSERLKDNWYKKEKRR